MNDKIDELSESIGYDTFAGGRTYALLEELEAMPHCEKDKEYIKELKEKLSDADELLSLLYR